MLMPRSMRKVELTMLDRDADTVLEYFGKRGILQIAVTGEGASSGEPEAAPSRPGDGVHPGIGTLSPSTVVESRHEEAAWRARLDRLLALALWLGVDVSALPGDDTQRPGDAELCLFEATVSRVEALRGEGEALHTERKQVDDALREASAFSRLSVPFSEIDKLSYLTLRIGSLSSPSRGAVSAALGERAVIIPLGDGDRVLAASSRKGRFALDGELEKVGFIPASIPEGTQGIPEDAVRGLEAKVSALDAALKSFAERKAALGAELARALVPMAAAFRMALSIERLKGQLEASNSAYVLTGWLPKQQMRVVVADLEKLTDGRLAIRAFEPREIEDVRSGKETVPTSLEHGAFVSSFERLVFAYGAPLYGTLDPTVFVALSFTLLFGIMFGDLGQGAVLFCAGLYLNRAGRRGQGGFVSKFTRYGPALIAVGCASMVMGLLSGSVFANENLLVAPTRAITAAIFGEPGLDRILALMPEKGSLDKLFAFFGFTLALGAVLNTLGLVVNIVNRIMLRQWKDAFISKTGLAGAILFWYALYIAIRSLLAGLSFGPIDAIMLLIPTVALFLGRGLWDFIAQRRNPFHEGVFSFIVEGFVEVLESASYYISNSVSYLRVGAFALSHAVLSFIVFQLADLASGAQGLVGGFAGALVILIGNAIIIGLEGMIVAIQVVRLQYYEFFSKFFAETGVEFSPFRFTREVSQ